MTLPWTFASLASGNQPASKLDDNFNALLAWAVAGGTADAITATYAPANTVLSDGLMLGFRATGSNATTTPTFSPDGLTAHNITKSGGAVLAVGDIPGNLAECIVRYNLANTRWELLNPSPLALPIYRSYLAGLGMSTAGGSITMTVAAGQAVDGGNTALMTLAASIGKTTASWVVGSGLGGLDTGLIANSTWYHFWLIKRTDTGVVDVLISLSATAPTMPTNYTLKRRIGSGKTDGGGNWTAFTQDGDYFRLSASVLDVNTTNPGTAAVTATLTAVPTGINVQSLINVLTINSAATSPLIYVSDLSANDEAPSVTATPLSSAGTQTSAGGLAATGNILVRTNTSAQIRYRILASDANTTVRIATLGWIDTRGKLA